MGKPNNNWIARQDNSRAGWPISRQAVTFSAILLLVVIGFIVYRPLLSFNFFWEDPVDIGQVDQYSYGELFQVATNNLYYRPLQLAIVKALKFGGDHFIPLPYYLFNIITRIGSSVLLFGLAVILFQKRLPAFAAALVFLISPITYDSTGKAMSAHQPLMVPVISLFLLYVWGREKNRPLMIFFAFLLEIVALLIHENAVLIPFMIVLLEAFLVWRHRVERFSFLSLLFFIPSLVFTVIWLAIPKADSALTISPGVDKALYLSQSLTFPVASVISQFGLNHINPEVQAGLALLMSLLLLFILYSSQNRPFLIVFIAMWLISTILLWLTLSMDYLETGSRLLYFPSFVVAIIWGGVIASPARSWQRTAGIIVLCFFLAHSLFTVHSLNRLYGYGSKLMDEIIDAGVQQENLLFANVPDRFQYKNQIYPIGFWGMMLAPVSQDLADFVKLASNREIITESVSTFPLTARMIENSPYKVNTRGSDKYATQALYESILSSDEAYWVEYFPDGSLDLKSVGTIDEKVLDNLPLVQFGDKAQLSSASVRSGNNGIFLDLEWVVTDQFIEGDAVFIHLSHAVDGIIAQADGDSLGGMIPLSAWRPGQVVTDRRFIPIGDNDLIAGTNIYLGIYNRFSGERLPAIPLADVQTFEDAYVIPQIYGD